MPVTWPDDIDAILGGDLAAAIAYVTPADGVVVMPMAPLGLRDREAGTVSVTSSLGLWKKIERIRRNPSVAIAYHAREHGDAEGPDFVLVQGTAEIPEPDRAYLDSIRPQMEHFLGPRKERGLAGWWLRVYTFERVPIHVSVKRILRWRDPRCAGEPEVLGEPLPAAAPPPQAPPRQGTASRVDARRVAKQCGGLPHTLLGWTGADGLPVVVAAAAREAGDVVALDVPSPLLPDGARRAGLTAHAFAPRMVGQEQRVHTGWLEVEGDRASYAPHTRAGHRLPESQLLFTLGSGAATRLGLRAARKAGVAR